MTYNPINQLGFEQSLINQNATWCTCPDCLEDFDATTPMCECYENKFYNLENNNDEKQN